MLECWPNIATLAIGSYLDPEFAMGAAAGLLTLSTGVLIGGGLEKLGVVPKEKRSKYLDELAQSPILAGLFAPIVEEVWCRGILQNIIGTVPAAVSFGLMHLRNDHASAKIQAFVATFMGFILGEVYENFGLLACSATHMMNNSVAVLASKFTSLNCDERPIYPDKPFTPKEVKEIASKMQESLRLKNRSLLGYHSRR